MFPGRTRWVVAMATVALVAVLVVAALAVGGGSADVVVYNGRSQYGDESAFTAFEDRTGKTLELRGGTAPELFERLESEGEDTPADLLVTTDLANLWRAKEAGLLEPVNTARLRRQVPDGLRDPDGDWWGLSLRIRTPMRSTERVAEGRYAATPTSATGAGAAGSACARATTSTTNRSWRT